MTIKINKPTLNLPLQEHILLSFSIFLKLPMICIIEDKMWLSADLIPVQPYANSVGCM